jgi:hypothetical protein
MSERDLLVPKIHDPIADAFCSNDHHRMKIDSIFRQFNSSEEGISTEQAREVRDAVGVNYVTPPTQFSTTFCCGFPCFGNNALEKYHQLIVSNCLAKRNGKWGTIDTISLVPGDLIRIGVGDRVPADMRIFKGRSCVFDTSLLKGIGTKVSVDVNNGNTDSYLDSPRIAFLGYRCVAGECMGIVLATGENTLVARMIKHSRWPLPDP